MSDQFIPKSFWFLDEDEEHFLPKEFAQKSGLSIYEDDDNIALEAALPGLKRDDVHVSMDKGIVTIIGEKREEKEDRKKKYYRKARSNFTYRIAVPGDVDEGKNPEASFNNGVLKVTFSKAKKTEPRKISIK